MLTVNRPATPVLHKCRGFCRALLQWRLFWLELKLQELGSELACARERHRETFEAFTAAEKQAIAIRRALI